MTGGKSRCLAFIADVCGLVQCILTFILSKHKCNSIVNVSTLEVLIYRLIRKPYSYPIP